MEPDPQINEANDTQCEELAMLDVHPPHLSVHTWRDFLIHIATITIGLLIAIGLEQIVEAVHHRHLRQEGQESLRREVSENETTLRRDLQSLQRQRMMLERNIQILHQLGTHQKASAGALDFSWQWSSMQDAAWQTARDTATLALFPSERVEEYNSVYVQQAIVNEGGVALIRDLTNAGVPLRLQPDVAALTAAQIDELARGSAVGLNQIEYIEALANTLAGDYERILSVR